MDDMQYTLLTEVIGRWKAEILESYLRSEEINVVLIQESVAGSTQQTSFAPVQVYVPKASIQRARTLLDKFNEAEDDEGETEDGK
jgi:hypothetical protein